MCAAWERAVVGPGLGQIRLPVRQGSSLRGGSGGEDATVRWWDLTTGRFLHALTGHTTQINDVALSADGHHALSGSEDETLRWWDLDEGRCLHQVRTTYVASAAMIPDAHHAVSGMSDGSVLLWEVDWDYEFPVAAGE
jgi:WD40 repeat protein